MIIKQEDLLRRYLMEKERYVSLLKTERGYFNELKTIVKESLRKVFNLDCYPIDKVLLTREQALYYIKNTILKEWDGSKFKVMSNDFDSEVFKQELEDFFNSDSADQIFSKNAWDFNSFSKLIHPGGYVGHHHFDGHYLRLVYSIPVKNKYLVHGVYSKTIFFDCMILEEKIKSIFIHHSPLSSKEKADLHEVYTAITAD